MQTRSAALNLAVPADLGPGSPPPLQATAFCAWADHDDTVQERCHHDDQDSGAERPGQDEMKGHTRRSARRKTDD